MLKTFNLINIYYNNILLYISIKEINLIKLIPNLDKILKINVFFFYFLKKRNYNL